MSIVSISAAPVRHRDGSFAGAIGMNADLTALKSREQRLSKRCASSAPCSTPPARRSRS